MEPLRRTFDAVVWRWEGEAAWHFVTVPTDLSDEIADRVAGHQTGFGSVPVEAEIGPARWRTSLFPDRNRGAYILPVKRQIRDQVGITEGSTVTVSVAC